MNFIKSNHQLDKLEIGFIVLVVLSVIGVSIYALSQGKHNESRVTNFEQCVSAGNPIKGSHPEQCVMGEKTFVNTYQVVNE